MKSPVELKYITLAQIIGCCLVILGHSFSFVTPYPCVLMEECRFLYAFHMPLFVWCSGFLFAHTMQTERKTFVQYASQRALKLLVSYFLISLIGLVPKILASSVLNDTLNMDAMEIVRAFLVPREGVWGHFWFLPMIYLIGVIGYLLDKISKKVGTWIVITLVAFALSFFKSDVLGWFGVNDVLLYFMYYSMGVVSDRMAFNMKLCNWMYLVGAVLMALALFFTITSGVGMIHCCNTVIAILMIFAIVQLCRMYADRTTIQRKSLIAQTYQIFILSWPCQLLVGVVVERILHMNWTVFIPVVFVTGIVMPLILLKLMDWLEEKIDVRYMSFILGR